MGTPTVTADDLSAALARFDREATQHTFHTGRYRMRYASLGAGPPLVVVHGLSDLGRAFAPILVALADRFRCVAVELPNGLDDDARLKGYTHTDHAADLIALIDHLGAEPANVMGSSFGSTVVLAALAAAPEKFRRAVLQSGFARRPLTRIERGLSVVLGRLPGRMRHLPGRRRVMSKLDRPAFVAAAPAVYEFFLSNVGQTPIRAAARRALILDKLDLRPLLPSIRTPVLMFGGDRDAIVPRILERQVEDLLPDVRRVEFTPCGHYSQYTHPAGMVAAMRDFLG